MSKRVSHDNVRTDSQSPDKNTETGRQLSKPRDHMSTLLALIGFLKQERLKTREWMRQRVTDLHWDDTRADVLVLLHDAAETEFFSGLDWTQREWTGEDSRKRVILRERYYESDTMKLPVWHAFIHVHLKTVTHGDATTHGDITAVTHLTQVISVSHFFWDFPPAPTCTLLLFFWCKLQHMFCSLHSHWRSAKVSLRV